MTAETSNPTMSILWAFVSLDRRQATPPQTTYRVVAFMVMVRDVEKSVNKNVGIEMVVSLMAKYSAVETVCRIQSINFARRPSHVELWPSTTGLACVRAGNMAPVHSAIDPDVASESPVRARAADESASISPGRPQIPHGSPEIGEEHMKLVWRRMLCRPTGIDQTSRPAVATCHFGQCDTEKRGNSIG